MAPARDISKKRMINDGGGDNCLSKDNPVREISKKRRINGGDDCISKDNTPWNISKKRKINGGDDCKKLRINAGAHYIPKDNPAKPRGDDAHFFNEAALVIGVADGVGGWAERGVDAGEYARELMRNAAETVEEYRHPVEVNPIGVLYEAYKNTDAVGSSTACIIAFTGGLLRAANLGDSGFLVVRAGKTVYKSEPQQHRFNFPYQIGTFGDSPVAAEKVEMAVEKGDVIVVGTDGLFDNLFDEDIEAVLATCLKENYAPEVTACEVAKAAREQSLKKRSPSPFEVAAYDAGVVHFGGKTDDITVVIAYIV